MAKPPTTASRAPLVNINVSAPLELIALDFLKLDRSSDGFENVLVITDYFTKLAVAVATRNQTAVTTARALWQHFVLKYRCPAKILADRGANFESLLMKELCQLYNISKSRTTPYHHSGNGLCERFNRILINMVRTLSEEKKKQWPAHLAELTYLYNNTQHSSTKQSPFCLMFGRHGRLPIDLELPVASQRPATVDWVSFHHERLHHAHTIAEREIRKALETQKRLYDKGTKDRPFHVETESS